MISATRATALSYPDADDDDDLYVEREAPLGNKLNAGSSVDCQEFLILRQPGRTIATLKTAQPQNSDPLGNFVVDLQASEKFTLGVNNEEPAATFST